MLTTGIKITPISLDGPGIDDTLFPNYVVDNGVGLKLGISATPAFFLVRPPDLNNVVEIGQGFLSLTDLEQRIVDQSYFKGWIDESLYKTTRVAQQSVAIQGAPGSKTSLTADDETLIRSVVSRLKNTQSSDSNSSSSDSN